LHRSEEKSVVMVTTMLPWRQRRVAKVVPAHVLHVCRRST